MLTKSGDMGIIVIYLCFPLNLVLCFDFGLKSLCKLDLYTDIFNIFNSKRAYCFYKMKK